MLLLNVKAYDKHNKLAAFSYNCGHQGAETEKGVLRQYLMNSLLDWFHIWYVAT